MYYNNTSLTYASPFHPFLLAFLYRSFNQSYSAQHLYNNYVIIITSCDLLVLKLCNIVVMLVGALKMVQCTAVVSSGSQLDGQGLVLQLGLGLDLGPGNEILSFPFFLSVLKCDKHHSPGTLTVQCSHRKDNNST